ncbi:hypothetical protein ScPMuIL_003728 [Solemya velum]
MADVESRREARRRKILQNSEQRMKILAGGGRDDFGVKDICDKSSSEDPPLSLTGNLIVGKEPDTTKLLEQNAFKNEQNQPTDDSESSIRAQKSGGGTVKISKLPPRTPISNESKSSTIKAPPVTTKDTIKQNSQLFNTLRMSCCVLLAFVARWVLSSDYGIFYVQSIIAPFAAMEMALFFYQHQTMGNVSLPHKNNMMATALMLCGIKPDIINYYNQIMGYFSAVTEDLALYIFTFLLAHMFT